MQLRALPVARLGADVIAQAKSGTGKTLVFSVVAAEAAVAAPSAAAQGPAALLLAPTRELAGQTARVVGDLCLAFEQSPGVALLIGGCPERDDEARLAAAPPGVVVATPGRALALVKRGCLRVCGLKLLVLDEADRLIDSSLGDVVPRICELLPARKQTLAFSATYPVRLQRLLDRVMRNPTHVQLCEEPDGIAGGENGETERAGKKESGSANRKAVLIGVRQRKVLVDDEVVQVEDTLVAKSAVVTALLEHNPFSFCIVFTNDKRHGRSVASHLREKGFASANIHANVRQSDRSAVMQSVKQGKLQVLVSTDLLARGVDIESCDLVVHLDVPMDSATYLHRVGRAGRFGKLGLSVILHCGGEETAVVQSLEKALGFCMQEMHIPVSLGCGRGPCSLSVAKAVPSQGSIGEGKSKMDGNGKTRRRDRMDISTDADALVDDSLKKASSLVTKKRKTIHHQIERLENRGSQLKEGLLGDDPGDCHAGNVENARMVGVEDGEEFGQGQSQPVQNKSTRTGGGERSMDEVWEAYARKSYDEGYRQAYERAYRMARLLRERLLRDQR